VTALAVAGLALLSNAPSDDPAGWFLTNEEALRARGELNEKAGSKRLYAHAVFTPGQPGWIEPSPRKTKTTRCLRRKAAST
jgi:hypothetical protein